MPRSQQSPPSADASVRPQLVASMRPHRADAARNFDAVLTAGRQLFNARGPEVTMVEIAEAAGVGIATLYRNFTSREELIEAIYVAEVAQLCDYSDELVELSADEAIDNWLRRFLRYMMTKRVLAEGLNEHAADYQESPAYQACRTAIYATGTPLIAAAQADGTVRVDVGIDDAMRFVMAISLGVYTSDAQRDRVMEVAIAGLHTPGGRAASDRPRTPRE